RLKPAAISVMLPGNNAYPVLPATCDSGTNDNCLGRPPYPAAQRPSGGQKLVMASTPFRYEVNRATASQVSAPGGMYCLACIICCRVLTAAGLLTPGFMDSGSNHAPPLTRNQHSNQFQSVPPVSKPTPKV